VEEALGDFKLVRAYVAPELFRYLESGVGVIRIGRAARERTITD
jgi:hypothetical protein